LRTPISLRELLMPAIAIWSRQDFLLTFRKYPKDQPPKAERTWLKHCMVVHKEGETLQGQRHAKGGVKTSSAESRTPAAHLMRRRKSQGPPYKCPALRESLFDWFVDVRASIASTLSPKFVLMKAQSIAQELMEVQRRTGKYTSMPKVDKHWLQRWKRDHRVVFRRPNRRFKASKAVMTARLRAMWLNVIRVRRLAQLAVGNDLATKFYGCDEKPLHFNEGGSKNTRTLEIAGAPAVRLKRNHAASRERVSVMTLTTSDPTMIAEGLPVLIVPGLCTCSSRRGRSLRWRSGGGGDAPSRVRNGCIAQ
jgi:hypothetical protein